MTSSLKTSFLCWALLVSRVLGDRIDDDETDEGEDWRPNLDDIYEKHGRNSDSGADLGRQIFAPLLNIDAQEKKKMLDILKTRIEENMDKSRDPCNDFFGYSCGGWLKKNPIPPDLGLWGVMDKIQNANDKTVVKALKAINLEGMDPKSALWKGTVAYRQCLDQERTDAKTPRLLEIVAAELAGMSVVVDSEDTQKEMWRNYYDPDSLKDWNFNEALIRAHVYRGSKAFFDVYPFTDNEDAKKRILKFQPAGLEYTSAKDLENTNKTAAMKDLMTAAIKLMVPLGNAQAARFGCNVMTVETTLAKYFLNPVDKVDAVKTFNKVPFKHLFEGQPANKTPDSLYIDFNAVLRAYKIRHIRPETIIDVEDKTYFKHINEAIPKLGSEKIRDYIVWSAIGVEHRILPSRVQKKYQDYRFRVYGKTLDRPPEIRCLKIVSKMFPFVISRLFQNTSFPESHKNYVTAMVQFLKMTLLMRIPNLEWMDQVTKNRTSEKVLNMVTNLGYPDFVTNLTELNAAVKSIKVVEEETIWQTYEKYLHDDVRGFDMMLRANRSRFGWSYPDVSEANAGYKAASNNLEFPAGILQEPLFHPSLPKFWNFGAIAVVLGHEMSHGFDKSGSRFDKEGKQSNWWTTSSWKGFEKRSKCFQDFYSNYKIQGIDVNGNLTVDENIADVGGISIAYHAYQNWKKNYAKKEELVERPIPDVPLSDNQLFFVAYGQSWCENSRTQSQLDAVRNWEHCPQPVRAEASAALIPEFAKEFKCPPKAKMNPMARCGIWYSNRERGAVNFGPSVKKGRG